MVTAAPTAAPQQPAQLPAVADTADDQLAALDEADDVSASLNEVAAPAAPVIDNTIKNPVEPAPVEIIAANTDDDDEEDEDEDDEFIGEEFIEARK